MLDPRTFISRVARALLAAPLAAEAQREARIARLGFLSPNLATNLHLSEAFRQGLRDLGYRAFSDIARARAGALTVLPSGMFIGERIRIVDLAARNRLPAIYQTRESVDAGGLMSYGPNLADLFRRAAAYVDKILHGAKPADLAIEQPTKFELVINLRTAKALGLTMPQALLLRADAVIQ